MTEQGWTEALNDLVRQQYEKEQQIINAFMAMNAHLGNVPLNELELVVQHRYDPEGVTTKYWVQKRKEAGKRGD